MKNLRKVNQIIEPVHVIEGAGVHLRRSIATRALKDLDPFLLFDHFGSDDPEDYLPGFPMHPHRGIETVTYMLAGKVRHEDSLGNAGWIQSGDVQWMTSGRGILHEEMPKPQADGRMEGFQLWVNLPARLKMSAPRYQEILSGEIPEIQEENGSVVRLVAGEYAGQRGPVTEIAIQPNYLDVQLAPGATWALSTPPGHTAFAYLYAGQVKFGEDDTISSTRLVVFGDGEGVSAQASTEAARFLFVSGAPLGEPIARYGPFVMNTREEIEQTLRELREGTFIQP